MNIIFAVLAMVASVLLTLVIVVQNSKGGGLSSTFGASNLSSMIGNRRAAQDIEKFTWYLISAVFVISFVASINVSSGPVQQTDNFGNLLNGVPTAPANPAPAAPGAAGFNPGGPAPAGNGGATPPAGGN